MFFLGIIHTSLSLPQQILPATKDNNREDTLTDGEESLVYSSPPPQYEPIYGVEAVKKGIKTNLMSHFVDMRASGGGFGQVFLRSSVKGRLA